MNAIDETVQSEIDRILHSETLHSSEGLRRLLKFLAEKSLAGEADQLKEYSIGMDAFGKPSTYDPRHDSTVRIQVGRLRQKLAEYFQTEGKDDPIVIDLPKGRFKLSWQPRPPAQVFVSPAAWPWRRTIWITSLALVSAWAAFATLELREERLESSYVRAQWTPELETLWAPFVAPNRPLLISISAPLFVELPGIGFFRDTAVNRMGDVSKSRSIASVQKALKASAAQPLYYYSTIGDVDASFMLGRLLATRQPNISIVNGSELSWRQLSENNVLFLGSPKFFNPQLGSMPVNQELVLEPKVGIRNLHARPGEPALFIDQYLTDRTSGMAYALVTHTPGPLGNGNVESFASRNSAGILAAAQWFTEPGTVRTLFAKMKKPSGEFPRYYQVLLKVRFQDGVPLETSYLLHRELESLDSK